jgi:hypothetical protein
MNGKQILCETLSKELGSLFTCAPHDRFVRIRTPFQYPDGDVIDLFVLSDDGSRTITDLGETTGWLRMQSISTTRSMKQKRLIEDVCQSHGIELFKGMLLLRGNESASLADGVIRLSQSAIRVADLWFTFRSRSVEILTDEVADYLATKEIPFDRAEKLVGRSGKPWSVDFHTRTARRSSLVQVLTTGSRNAARQNVEHVLAGWHDLNLLKTGSQPLHFVSLFDDTVDVWGPDDFKLVDDVSFVARWSRPDELELFLRAA